MTADNGGLTVAYLIFAPRGSGNGTSVPRPQWSPVAKRGMWSKGRNKSPSWSFFSSLFGDGIVSVADVRFSALHARNRTWRHYIINHWVTR